MEEDDFEDMINSRKDPIIPGHLPWIDRRRICKAMRSFSDFKASGPDDLKPIVIKWLPDNAIELLWLIFMACIKLYYTPKMWRQSCMVFIPKPGKDDYMLPKSFRPFSLTSFLFKTLERLVLWHLEATSFRRQRSDRHVFYIISNIYIRVAD